MPEFNGHKNWNYWNVSQWINKDAGLYRTARAYCRMHKNKQRAAVAMVEHLQSLDMRTTPDGAPYSVPAVAAAMGEIDNVEN